MLSRSVTRRGVRTACIEAHFAVPSNALHSLLFIKINASATGSAR